MNETFKNQLNKNDDLKADSLNTRISLINTPKHTNYPHAISQFFTGFFSY